MAEKNERSDASQPIKPTGWRYKVGSFMFAIPFAMFVGAPIVVPLLGFSASQSAALIGGIIVAAEVIWFASIPLLGVAGFKAMKKKAFGIFKLRSGPTSPGRHRFGLLLVSLSLLTQFGLQLAVLVAYFFMGTNPNELILGMSFDQQAMLYAVVVVIAMISLVVGLYLLGEQFITRIQIAFKLPK